MLRELHRRFPNTERIPHVPLGVLPTPVEEAPRLAQAAGADTLWIKRDDLSGVPYGGNKVRKLEFLLGEVPGVVVLSPCEVPLDDEAVRFLRCYEGVRAV